MAVEGQDAESLLWLRMRSRRKSDKADLAGTKGEESDEEEEEQETSISRQIRMATSGAPPVPPGKPSFLFVWKISSRSGPVDGRCFGSARKEAEALAAAAGQKLGKLASVSCRQWPRRLKQAWEARCIGSGKCNRAMNRLEMRSAQSRRRSLTGSVCRHRIGWSDSTAVGTLSRSVP